ncbi:ROK family protein [Planosporangium thailandense]|uniref:ROK family protein n=1 Tax=Planosporangium thailandense TaxID=765197 RepID=A0ABX0Y1T4_9ACTN|nr:ROK family protein [Planosporangium thailandense]NJC72316.1 ROK family protein [Planosporangium thailandense]
MTDTMDGPDRPRAGGPDHMVIGIDLGGTKCHAALASGADSILVETHELVARYPDAVTALEAVIGELQDAARRLGGTVGGVAVGVPANVDPATGLIVNGLNLGWDRIDLRARLDRVVDAPYTIENDVNLAAIGEASRGAGRDATSFVVLALGTGLGGAAVVNGSLIRGRHNAAGEVGYLVADRHQLRKPGLLGMESIVGGLGIAARARELATLHPESCLHGVADLDAATVLAAAVDRDVVAEQILDEVIDHLAMTVIDVTAVLDAELVIVTGGVGHALAAHLPRVRDIVRQTFGHAPELVVSQLRPSAALAGALTRARRIATHGD